MIDVYAPGARVLNSYAHHGYDGGPSTNQAPGWNFTLTRSGVDSVRSSGFESISLPCVSTAAGQVRPGIVSSNRNSLRARKSFVGCSLCRELHFGNLHPYSA